jgi:hypothetical protein
MVMTTPIVVFACSAVFALSAFCHGLDYNTNGVLVYYFDLVPSATTVSSWFRYFIPLLLAIFIAISGCILRHSFIASWLGIVLLGLSVPLALIPSSVEMYASEYVVANNLILPVVTAGIVLAAPPGWVLTFSLVDLLGRIVPLLALLIDNWRNTATIITTSAVPLFVPIIAGIFVWLGKSRKREYQQPHPNWIAQIILAVGSIACQLVYGICTPRYTAWGTLAGAAKLGACATGAIGIMVLTGYMWIKKNSNVRIYTSACGAMAIGTTICACVPIGWGGSTATTFVGTAMATTGYYVAKYVILALVIDNASQKTAHVVVGVQMSVSQLVGIVLQALHCELADCHAIYVGTALFVGIHAIALIWGNKCLVRGYSSESDEEDAKDAKELGTEKSMCP